MAMKDLYIQAWFPFTWEQKEEFSNLSVKNPEYIYNRFSFYNGKRC